MRNQIPHPTSSPDRNLSKNKYVHSTIMVDSFYWNSIGSWIPTHKNLLLAHFLIRPILDPKFPLMKHALFDISRIWPSITPLKHYIRNPLDTLKGEELKNKKTIVHCFHSLNLSQHPLSLGALGVLPKLAFACELAVERWRIEVVEAQVEDSFSLVRKRADRGCHLLL